MNRAKKLMSLLMALVMVFAMATALAETGSITVENPVEGRTYTAYKIFDVTYDGNAYAYTIDGDSEWFSVVNTYASDTSKGLTLTKAANDNVYVVEVTSDFSAADFANILKANTAEKSGTALTGDKPSVADLPLGYYFVTSNTGALCNLTTTDPNALIYDKNDVPFDKVDDDESVEVGQVVNYTVTSKVPSTEGFNTYAYVITDTMSEGLDFNSDVVITVGGVTLSEDHYTLTYTPADADEKTGFELAIDVMELQNQIGAEIKLEYTATVNESAVTKVEKNNAKLTYSNDPTDDTKKGEIKDEETVYTAKIIVDKYAEGAETTKLDGAKFVLYKQADGTKYYYFYDETIDKVTWVKLTDAELEAALTANPQTVTEKVTDENGACEFIGLEDGTYYLLETEAPQGYNLLKTAVEVVVEGAAAITANATQEQIEAALTDTVGVANNTGVELPETGGVGTTMLYVGGGVLVLAAVVLLITKKRMSAK